MSGHTPGPWSVPHLAEPGVRCDCGYVVSESQRGMGAICEVFMDRGGEPAHPGGTAFDSEYEERSVAEANARLIAAAPDLLEALEELFGVAAPESPCEAGAFLDAMAHAEAAIAKAKGEA